MNNFEDPLPVKQNQDQLCQALLFKVSLYDEWKLQELQYDMNLWSKKGIMRNIWKK